MTYTFEAVAVSARHPNYPKLTTRRDGLYTREADPRDPFNRDYNRILHCTAYRRLKNKTQVFYATENDHVCTRIEHVNHVVAISHTISENFKLNSELTNAIAIGHDIGHAPFGHEGGEILSKLAEEKLGYKFWHERNSLWFVDNIETLSNEANKQVNMSLTYAVRDGIISHCGEVDDRGIKPRTDFIELEKSFKTPSQFQPITWEGCIVKIADKIAYLGRDIEDAFTIGLFSREDFYTLVCNIAPEFPSDFSKYLDIDLRDLNNANLIHRFILDLLENSSLERGLAFSSNFNALMINLRSLSNKLIYKHKRLKYFVGYAKLILSSIFNELESYYDSENPENFLERLKHLQNFAPRLYHEFLDWSIKYTSIDTEGKKQRGYNNIVVYDYFVKNSYLQSVLNFISGMTDRFAIFVHRELTSFK